MSNSPEIDITVTCTGKDAPTGNFLFNWSASGTSVDSEGNITLSSGSDNKLVFTLLPGTGTGVTDVQFLDNGREACYIVGGSTTPMGPYNGNNFSGFKLSNHNRTLTIIDNDLDREKYTYVLRVLVFVSNSASSSNSSKNTTQIPIDLDPKIIDKPS